MSFLLCPFPTEQNLVSGSEDGVWAPSVFQGAEDAELAFYRSYSLIRITLPSYECLVMPL